MLHRCDKFDRPIFVGWGYIWGEGRRLIFGMLIGYIFGGLVYGGGEAY